MWVTPAYAQGFGGGGGSEMIVSILPFILIFAIMYFLVLRPQRQRMKAHQEMVSALRRGDTVVTAGGLIGKITKVVDENEVQVELSEGVRVRLVRSTITEVRAKSEPVNDNG
ncbi:preprotein translocase subunit YajC [Amorphus sp. 3PC139-8]|uniref:preprotein translocase subunit YajC n=1 Tax=Amorphus sp. 3PC139-8 TaxID=2735676 RepID=UPI00345D4ABF